MYCFLWAEKFEKQNSSVKIRMVGKYSTLLSQNSSRALDDPGLMSACLFFFLGGGKVVIICK